jgi:hypothetical protein
VLDLALLSKIFGDGSQDATGWRLPSTLALFALLPRVPWCPLTGVPEEELARAVGT